MDFSPRTEADRIGIDEAMRGHIWLRDLPQEYTEVIDTRGLGSAVLEQIFSDAIRPLNQILGEGLSINVKIGELYPLNKEALQSWQLAI